MEILAPVGSPEVVAPAVFSGADAIYVGMKQFSARDSAGNFSNEELKKCTEFCHARDVKVFVAINVLIKDNEIEEVLKAVKFLCEIAVDAIIVQDMGLFYLLKKCCEDMPIHCSTQMSLSCKSAVSLLETLGAQRAVLAREMSFEEIKKVKNNTNLELEVFVHGAMCMCVSGQCYFSAMLGSRSGNRGKCAQTCRLPFWSSNYENALSLKDLSYVKNLKDLERVGITSAKIEGRMKREEYVSMAVKACNSSLENDILDEEIMQNLKNVFSRSGFTSGYFDAEINHNMFGIRTKEDVLKSNSELYGKIHDFYRNEYKRVPLDIKIKFKQNSYPVVSASDTLGNTAIITGENKPQKAKVKAMSKEDLENRFSKLGSTQFYVNSIKIDTDEDSVLPVSQINELRRKMCQSLSELKSKRKSIDFKEPKIDLPKRELSEFTLRAEFNNFEQIPEDVSMFEYIYLPLHCEQKNFEELLEKGVKLCAIMPKINFYSDETIAKKVKTLYNIGVEHFACGNLYAVKIIKDIGAKIHGQYSLNAINSYSVKQFEELGIEDLEMSFEIKDTELYNIKSNAKLGLMIYGRQSLMLTRACPVKTNDKSCLDCKGTQTLRDRKDIEFPVICNKFSGENINKDKFDFYAEILNSTPLCLSDRIKEIKNADFGIIRFTVENSVEIVDIISDLIRHKNPNKTYTRGLFYRGIL